MNGHDLFLIGDLQCFALPYISLYYNNTDNDLYMSVRTSDYDDHIARFILFDVESNDVLAFIQQSIDVKQLLINSRQAFCWYLNARQNTGRFEKVDKQSALSLIDDNDTYDPEFCATEPLIKHFLRNKTNNINHKQFAY